MARFWTNGLTTLFLWTELFDYALQIYAPRNAQACAYAYSKSC